MPALTFLAVDGVGDPNGLHFEQAVGALYAVAYTLKFALKKADGPDYTVMPLGALWGSGEQDDSALPREEWPWTALICQPEPLPAGMLDEAIAKCRAKDPNPALDRLRLIDLNEGEAAQLLHLGPYADEGPSLERLHAFITASGLRFRGRNHEIYLSDPRRSAPEKLKTVLRHPVARG